jgi:hypothetical protein
MKVTLAVVAVLPAIVQMQNHFNGLRNVGVTLNSPDIDASANISPNGLSLYFQSIRTTGLGGSDIYVSQRPSLNSAWGVPQSLGATVNSSANDNVGSLSLDGRTMFLQSNRTGAGGLGGQDIYISTRLDANNDFGWTVPVNLGAVINSEFSELNATYFEDPVTGAGSLIFSSDRIAMNNVNHHLYQSTRNPDGTFNPPTLINELNSGGSEFGVAIRRDGLEIFFGSSRPGGLNNPAFDIWTSTRASISEPWNTPELARGINGLGNERFPKLSPDGAVLYLTSDRFGGFGNFDLYSATRCSLYSASPCTANRTASDFDADGQTDISVFRPSDGTWWVIESGTNTVSARQFGSAGDTPVPGDYDGDARLDLAVFRSSNQSWWILNSSNGLFAVTQFGLATDTPTPGDYDGDGRTDISVYRNGTWHIRQSSDGQIVSHQFGLNTDVAIPGIGGQ